MSSSLAVTTEGSSGQAKGSFPIHISQDVAREIDLIAAKRQVKVDVLVNEILQQYIARQSLPKRSSGATFLLSLAGMFSSGTSDTSESTHTIVTDFILKKEQDIP